MTEPPEQTDEEFAAENYALADMLQNMPLPEAEPLLGDVIRDFWAARPDIEPEEGEQEDIIQIADVYADLGGAYEVADALNVPKKRVDRWLERRAGTNCPRPVLKLMIGNVYSISDWRAWYRLWRVTRAPTLAVREGRKRPPKPKPE